MTVIHKMKPNVCRHNVSVWRSAPALPADLLTPGYKKGKVDIVLAMVWATATAAYLLLPLLIAPAPTLLTNTAPASFPALIMMVGTIPRCGKYMFHVHACLGTVHL